MAPAGGGPSAAATAVLREVPVGVAVPAALVVGAATTTVGEDESGAKQVWNLQPWYAKDFTVRNLADRIQDLPQLQYLYPNIPKATAFQPFCTEPKQTDISSDYVPSGIAAVIPQKADAYTLPLSAGTPDGPPPDSGGDGKWRQRRA